jgi:hypothetical protein
MNRHERRRQAKLFRNHSAKRNGLSIVAIHEAGHIVARFMTADLMGYASAEAVAYVDMHHPDTAPRFPGRDGRLYCNAATTFGPFYSKAINAAARDVHARYGIASQTTDDAAAILSSEQCCRDVMTAAVEAGADVKIWAVAKIFHAVGGAVAEAKARNLSFDDVAASPEYDMQDVGRASSLAGLSSEELENVIAKATEFLEDAWSDPRHWNALLGLAKALPHEGKMTGADCWAVYSRGLDVPDLDHQAEDVHGIVTPARRGAECQAMRQQNEAKLSRTEDER